MAQQYGTIDGDVISVKAGLITLFNNFKTLLSNSSGTAFPTSNLELGQLCFRSDEEKYYSLSDVAGNVWRDDLFGGSNIELRILTNNGIWIKPDNLKKALIIVQGAGGAGGIMSEDIEGTGCGGGQAGATVFAFVDASILINSITYTIGNKGLSLSSFPSISEEGATGTATTFGNYITAYGGRGGRGSHGQYQINYGGGISVTQITTESDIQNRYIIDSSIINYWALEGDYGGYGSNFIDSSHREASNLLVGSGGNSPFGTGGSRSSRHGKGKGSAGAGGNTNSNTNNKLNGRGTDGLIIIAEFT